MKSISFTEKEFDFLRSQYQNELESAQEYVDQIKEILKKVGAPSKTPIEEPIEQEPKVVRRRGRKPKAKKVEAKIPKRRGRKPKAVVSEPTVPKKMGRPFKVAIVPTVETTPITVAKRGRRPRIATVPTVVASLIEAKSVKRGRKPKTVVPTTESKERQKRGRKPKISVPKSEPKKRGRKPRVSAVPTSQPKSVPTPSPKEEKKIVKKKSPYRGKRKWRRGVSLAPMSKPIQFK